MALTLQQQRELNKQKRRLLKYQIYTLVNYCDNAKNDALYASFAKETLENRSILGLGTDDPYPKNMNDMRRWILTLIEKYTKETGFDNEGKHNQIVQDFKLLSDIVKTYDKSDKSILDTWRVQLEKEQNRTIPQIENRIAGLAKLDQFQRYAVYQDAVQKLEEPQQKDTNEALKGLGIETDDPELDQKTKEVARALKSVNDNKPLAMVVESTKNIDNIPVTHYQVQTSGMRAGNAPSLTTDYMYKRLKDPSTKEFQALKDQDLSVKKFNDKKGKPYLSFNYKGRPISEIADPKESARITNEIKSIINLLISDESHLPVHDHEIYVTQADREKALKAIKDAQEWLKTAENIAIQNVKSEPPQSAELRENVANSLKSYNDSYAVLDKQKDNYRPAPGEETININKLLLDMSSEYTKLRTWQIKYNQNETLNQLREEFNYLKTIRKDEARNTEFTWNDDAQQQSTDYLEAIKSIDDDVARLDIANKNNKAELRQQIIDEVYHEVQYIGNNVDRLAENISLAVEELEKNRSTLRSNPNTEDAFKNGLKQAIRDLSKLFEAHAKWTLKADGLLLGNVSPEIDGELNERFKLLSSLEENISLITERLELNQIEEQFEELQRADQALSQDLIQDNATWQKLYDHEVKFLTHIAHTEESCKNFTPKHESNIKLKDSLNQAVKDYKKSKFKNMLDRLVQIKDDPTRVMSERIHAAGLYESTREVYWHTFPEEKSQYHDDGINTEFLNKLVLDTKNQIVRELTYTGSEPLEEAFNALRAKHPKDYDAQLLKIMTNKLTEDELNAVTQHLGKPQTQTAQACADAFGKIFGDEFFKPYLTMRDRLEQLNTDNLYQENDSLEHKLKAIRALLHGADGTQRTPVELYKAIKEHGGEEIISPISGLYECAIVNTRFQTFDPDIQTTINDKIAALYTSVNQIINSLAAQHFEVSKDQPYAVALKDAEHGIIDFNKSADELEMFFKDELNAFIFRNPSLGISRWNFTNNFKATNEEVLTRIQAMASSDSRLNAEAARLHGMHDNIVTLREKRASNIKMLTDYKENYAQLIDNAIDVTHNDSSPFKDLFKRDELMDNLSEEMSLDQLKQFVNIFSLENPEQAILADKNDPNYNLVVSRYRVDAFLTKYEGLDDNMLEGKNTLEVARALEIALISNTLYEEYLKTENGAKRDDAHRADDISAIRLLLSRVSEDHLRDLMSDVRQSTSAMEQRPALTNLLHLFGHNNSSEATEFVDYVIGQDVLDLTIEGIVVTDQYPFITDFLTEIHTLNAGRPAANDDVSAVLGKGLQALEEPLPFESLNPGLKLLGEQKAKKEAMLANFMALPNMKQHEKALRYYIEANGIETLQGVFTALDQAHKAQLDLDKSGKMTPASLRKDREYQFKYAMSELTLQVNMLEKLHPNSIKLHQDLIVLIKDQALDFDQYILDKIENVALADPMNMLHTALDVNKLVGEKNQRRTKLGEKLRELAGNKQRESAGDKQPELADNKQLEAEYSELVYYLGTDNWSPIRSTLTELLPDYTADDEIDKRISPFGNEKVGEFTGRINAIKGQVDDLGVKDYKGISNHLYLQADSHQKLRDKLQQEGPAWKQELDELTVIQTDLLKVASDKVILLGKDLYQPKDDVTVGQNFKDADDLLKQRETDLESAKNLIKEAWNAFAQETNDSTLRKNKNPDLALIASLQGDKRFVGDPYASAVLDLVENVLNQEAVLNKYKEQLADQKQNIRNQEGRLESQLASEFVIDFNAKARSENSATTYAGSDVSCEEMIQGLKFEMPQFEFDQFVTDVQAAQSFDKLAALAEKIGEDKPLAHGYLRALMISRLATRMANESQSLNVDFVRPSVENFSEYFNQYNSKDLILMSREVAIPENNYRAMAQRLPITKNLNTNKPVDQYLTNIKPSEQDYFKLDAEMRENESNDYDVQLQASKDAIKSLTAQSIEQKIAWPSAEPTEEENKLTEIFEQFKDLKIHFDDPQTARNIATLFMRDPGIDEIPDMNRGKLPVELIELGYSATALMSLAQAGVERGNFFFGGDEEWIRDSYFWQTNALSALHTKITQAIDDGRLPLDKGTQKFLQELEHRIIQLENKLNEDDLKKNEGYGDKNPVLLESIYTANNQLKELLWPSTFGTKPDQAMIDSLLYGIELGDPLFDLIKTAYGARENRIGERTFGVGFSTFFQRRNLNDTAVSDLKAEVAALDKLLVAIPPVKLIHERVKERRDELQKRIDSAPAPKLVATFNTANQSTHVPKPVAKMTIENATAASEQILKFLLDKPEHYQTEGVFRVSSDRQNEDKAFEAIQKGENFTMFLEGEPNLSFTLLKRLLREFPPLDSQEKLGAALDPDFTLEQFMNGIEDESQKQLLSNVLTAAANVAQSSELNKMNASNVAIVLGPNLASPQLIDLNNIKLLLNLAEKLIKNPPSASQPSPKQIASLAPSTPNTSPAAADDTVSSSSRSGAAPASAHPKTKKTVAFSPDTVGQEDKTPKPK